MRSRPLIAFVVGAVMFVAVSRYVDRFISFFLPVQEYSPWAPIVVILCGAVGVGAVVFLLARERRLWWLAPASALASALAEGIYYEVFLEPPPSNGFELDAMLFGAFTVFLLTGSAATVGALLARSMSGLIASHGGRQRRTG